ncbi:peptidoglycan DD-metalloendopeptidase family protein [Isoptericola sp. S6320L]|uniref:murein hydrolase activator EnvC family protein n=1 Tax=Isoptericola sp. S6320L TaxID=2926411 RepID=UPI001FF59EAA|nr:M23 family metallopeptidase [Isoptericola sp. S6320L]MCK0117066.1 peptidoglycan DD-metalloendopeptidase family protein [Isoptericola sp. S6320L]
MPRFARTSPAHLHAVLATALTVLVLVGASATTTVQAATGSTPGAWQPPTPGDVVRRFDLPARPWLPGHRGIDLAAPAGTPVVSPAPGVVTFAGQVGGKPVVVVSHGDLRSTFEPVEAGTRVGDHVRAGGLVGRVAADGGSSHCAPTGCLHWGVRRGTAYLDPLALLGRAAPIVLLPLPTA